MAKLLTAALPDYALFGEKDYQQLLVVRRLVTDLNLPVEIIAGADCARARWPGHVFAQRLPVGPERKIAGQLNLVLKDVIAHLKNGMPVADAEVFGSAALKETGFDSVDYVALRDAETLAPMGDMERPGRLLAAARIGKTRLIDNIAV